VESFDLAEAAERSGCTGDELARLVDLGIITPDADGRFNVTHLRRIGLVGSLTAAGIQLDGLGAAIRDGKVSLDFLEAPAFERFSALGGETFAEVADRINAPVEQLMLVREATGSVAPRPGDRVRDAELAYADLIEVAVAAGFGRPAMEQMLRTQAESLRRVAETESALWLAEVIEPAVRSGQRPDEVLGAEFADRMSALTERALIAMYHLQQTRAWTSEIIEGLELQLAEAGLHSRLTHPPAMCFLDITGYTRLTQERGDAAAAELAAQLGRIVQRTAVQHRGRPVKWLGDGVMLHFPNAADGVIGALEMVRAVAEAGLPPAHVGLHAGPVIFQEGDYYGSTVNLASRISDHAGPGQVLVSQAVVDAASSAGVVFREVGPVELKGVAGAMPLFEARLRA
jgi:class 3 adenylate cyclase